MPLIDNMKEVSDEGKVVVSRERERRCQLILRARRDLISQRPIAIRDPE